MSDHPEPHHPDPTKQFAPRDYYHLLHTLYRGLPPPVDDTPEALLARNSEAIAELAAMLPTNPNEAAWAAQCVAARAQANDVMRLLRDYAGDELSTIMRLNAQYMAMTRASQGAHSHLLRAQAIRYRRENSDAALKADEWTQYVVTRSLEAAAMPAGKYAAQAAGEHPAQAVGEHSAQAAGEHSVPVAAEPLAQAPSSDPLPAAPLPLTEPPAPAPASVPMRALPPMQVAAQSPPPRATAQAPVPEPAASRLAAATQRSRRVPTPAMADDPPRDLLSEADYYANIYPDRAREIRRHRGLPPNCSFGPPDNAMVRALLSSNSAVLRALDGAAAAGD